MKFRKIILPILGTFSLLSSSIVLSCQNSNNNNSKNYDLGLVSEPINSLNYIRFTSVNRILPTLVESPLKSGPNEALKRILNLPEIPMGVYQNTESLTADEEENSSITSLDKLFKNSTPPTQPSTQFYPLDQFGATTGTLSSDKSVYQPVSIIMKDNKIQSMNLLLNDGLSKWSNGDVVTADDYIASIHYILDLSTGSQKLTSILQRKFKSAQAVVDMQQEYLKEFGITYKNPFQYPNIKKDKNGKLSYDEFNTNYKYFPSQINEILRSPKFRDSNLNESQIHDIKNKETKIIEKLKEAVLNLGLYSGRMYWNYSNKEIISSIPYSPDFDPNSDETIIMLPNPDYVSGKYTQEELKSIPQRIATKIRKFLYSDKRQTNNEEFKKLVSQAEKLKNKLNISYNGNNLKDYEKAVNEIYSENTIVNDFVDNIDAKSYKVDRRLALDEYSLRIEYSPSEPASLQNAVSDLNSNLVPINRKFVESTGGITSFGLDASTFLTNGAFNIKESVLGPQGYLLLSKNEHYYSSDKTSSNLIKIFFSSDNNINSALYDDKYIAATRIPPIQQLQYWTNLEYRKYMKKSQGFGTIALAFNLDKERYEKAKANGENLYLYDTNLRNAIYYAIDRNAMLNIVGWNSSYPVITWTAFGQGSSSFGDAIEIAFDHDQMFTKVDSERKHPIPIQNYKHLDHLSKNFNFEHVDRTDKAYRLDIAHKYIELFKKEHPEVSKVQLRFISNSTDEQQNAGIALQDFMRKAFGSFIEIEIKSLPENVYEDYRTKGEFDILYRNFDTFGTDSYSYVKVFFRPDGIDTPNAKQTGFRNNPAGSWTYQDYFSELGYYMENGIVKISNENKNKAEKTRMRLCIDEQVWNKIIELSFIGKKIKDKKTHQYRSETPSEYNDRFTAFFTNQFTTKEVAEGWTEQSAFAIVAGLEKIIRDGSPVVPLMEVDTYWEISRVLGAENLHTYSLQFAYDSLKPPKPTLPTQLKDDE